MTKEEMKEKAIAQLERVSRNLGSIGEEEDWTDYIIQELEQETVSKEVYDHEYFLRKEFEIKIDKLQRQLGKIRAEIEQNAYPIVHGVNNHELGMTLYGILQIFDKYKAESEKS